MGENSFILKGDLICSISRDELSLQPESFLVCIDGRSRGVFREIPEAFQGLPFRDFSGQMIIPGLCDLHTHAPQYAFRGLGMDLPLLDWLDTYAFQEEMRYSDLDYADRAYSQFVDALVKSPTTRVSIFATLHVPATVLLMEKLEASGLKGYVGKVSMDRSSPDYYREETAEDALSAMIGWLRSSRLQFRNFQPIITPRFTPSCTDDLMEMLGLAARETGARVQSHLSESPEEVEWVRSLCPRAGHYIDTYLQRGMLDPDRPSIMAHSVYSDEYERRIMRENNVFAAHCPQCNMNIASGMAPVRRWLDEGLQAGLGTDVAGGATLSLFRTMMEAKQVSSMVWRYQDHSLKPLTFEEVFYLATAGGGAFFGKTGSFQPGFELDALVLDETGLPSPRKLSLRERIERFAFLSGEQCVSHKFVSGRQLF